MEFAYRKTRENVSVTPQNIQAYRIIMEEKNQGIFWRHAQTFLDTDDERNFLPLGTFKRDFAANGTPPA
jgi:hypothetical protein